MESGVRSRPTTRDGQDEADWDWSEAELARREDGDGGT
jgi:hypothetical protein